MNDALKSLKRNKMLGAMVMLAVGVFFLAFPGESLSIAIIFAGVAALAGGVIEIISYLRSNVRSAAGSVNLIVGIAAAVIGISLIIDPKWPVSFLNVVAGMFLIVIGIANLLNSAKYHSSSVGGAMDFVPYIITVCLGIILFFNPWGTTTTLVRLIGIFTIYEAIADMFSFSRYHIG